MGNKKGRKSRRVSCRKKLTSNRLLALGPELPRMKSCRAVQALFPGYQAGKLSGKRSVAVNRHFRRCVGCVDAFREWVALMGRISEATAS